MKFVFLGDSNLVNYVFGSENMVDIMGSELGMTAVNAGVSGNKAPQMLARLDTDVIAESPDVCFVMAGTNDMAAAYENDQSNASMKATYLDAMGDIIDALAAEDIQTFIVSPPPARIHEQCLRWPEVLADLQDLCAARTVTYIALYEALAVAAENDGTFNGLYRADPDKYHLDVAGHAFAANVIVAASEGEIEQPPPPSGTAWDTGQAGTNLTYSDSGLGITQPSNETGGSAIGNRGWSSGKRYFEVTYATPVSLTAAMAGVTRGAYNTIVNLATTGADDYWYDSEGRINTNGSPAEATDKTIWHSSGNTVGVKLDLAARTLDFVDKNGSSFSGFTGLDTGTYYPIGGLMSGAEVGNKIIANFDGPFAHSLPSGYLAWGDTGG